MSLGVKIAAGLAAAFVTAVGGCTATTTLLVGDSANCIKDFVNTVDAIDQNKKQDTAIIDTTLDCGVDMTKTATYGTLGTLALTLAAGLGAASLVGRRKEPNPS